VTATSQKTIWQRAPSTDSAIGGHRRDCHDDFAESHPCHNFGNLIAFSQDVDSARLCPGWVTWFTVRLLPIWSAFPAKDKIHRPRCRTTLGSSVFGGLLPLIGLSVIAR